MAAPTLCGRPPPGTDPLTLHGGGGNVWSVAGESGICSYRVGSSSYGVRPALILPQAMPVEDGAVQPNSAPVLTSSSGVSGADLGTRNSPFSFEYMATDPEGASLSLTEKLDQAVNPHPDRGFGLHPAVRSGV